MAWRVGRDVLERLRPAHYAAARAASTECAICLDAMEDARTTQALVCGHRFHTECLLKRPIEQCPLCRAFVVPRDPGQREGWFAWPAERLAASALAFSAMARRVEAGVSPAEASAAVPEFVRESVARARSSDAWRRACEALEEAARLGRETVKETLDEADDGDPQDGFHRFRCPQHDRIVGQLETACRELFGPDGGSYAPYWSRWIADML